MRGARIGRDKRTVGMMVRLYCRGKHGTKLGLCGSCASLLSYARSRLDRCRFGDGKPMCSSCAVHCFNRAMRDEIRKVMRYAGPRLFLRHPIEAVRYFVDVLTKAGT